MSFAYSHCCIICIVQRMLFCRELRPFRIRAHRPAKASITTTTFVYSCTLHYIDLHTSRFQIWRGKRGNGQLLCPPRVTAAVGGVVILPRAGRYTFETLAGTAEAVRSYFRSDFPTAFGPDGPSTSFCEEFATRPAGSLKTTYCDRLADGHVALVSACECLCLYIQ
jgi:hypothetical protein